MRLLEMLVNVTALAFGLAILAFLAVLVAAFEFFGVLITGLVVLSRFQRGGQRMLSVIPSHSLVRDADHGGQIPCCRKRRAAA